MYGVIDIGSNTIRLVIYNFDKKLVPMINKKYSVGLAGYINEENCLSEQGIKKAINALNDFKETLKYICVKEVFPFATASVRNIANSEEVLKEIRNKTGFDIKLLSGKDEALFDYRGALRSINLNAGLLVDIGGGSSELVFFHDKKPVEVKSLPIGSLNLYKRYVKDLIPTSKEIKAIKNHVKELLNEVKLPELNFKTDTVCGVGGTARAAEKLLKDLNIIYTNEYPVKQLSKLLSDFKSNRSDFYDNLLKSSPDRIHTFVPGLVIFNTISKFYSCKSVVTGRYGVREGYLYSILTERGIVKFDEAL